MEYAWCDSDRHNRKTDNSKVGHKHDRTSSFAELYRSFYPE